jgi:serine/threonine protein kinase
MKPDGYFYYVMELGDGQTADWEKNPATYKPWDLTYARELVNSGRLPVIECIRIASALSESLDFLHRQGLTHRDIKPSNVIFVNGQPKLADVGMVSDIRAPGLIHTYVGTPGYMPPHPELPGTVAADLYALGMLLYVISTGREPDLFPNLSTTLMERTGHREFFRLNTIILRACQPDPARRYTSAAEMHAALKEAHRAMGHDTMEIA